MTNKKKYLVRIVTAVLIAATILGIYKGTGTEVYGASGSGVSYRLDYNITQLNRDTYSLTVTQTIDDTSLVSDEISRYGQSGNDIYILNTYTDTPVSNPRNFQEVASIRITNVSQTSKSVTLNKDIRFWNNKLKYGTATTPTAYTGADGVIFEGDLYVSHYAYMFAKWFGYTDPLADINNYNNGKAYKTLIKDYNIGQYKVNNGSWQNTLTSKTFKAKDYNPGDKIYFRTVSNLGITSSTVTYTVPGYKLTVDPNGGTWNGSTTSQTFTLAYGNTKSISEPTRSGYIFTGWTLSGNNSTISNSTFTMGYGEAKLKANWEDANGYIVFKAGDSGVKSVSWGGTEYSLSNGKSQTYTGARGTTMESVFKFNSGYSLDYTEVSDNATDKWSNNPEYWTVLKGTRTVTIHSKPNKYTLTINPNGGTMYNGSTTTTDKYNIQFQYRAKRGLGYYTDSYYGYDSTFGKPYRKGYTFAGWKVTSGGGTVSLITGTASDRPYAYMDDEFKSMSRPGSWSYYLFNGDYNGNVTITAQWEKNTFTMTISPNGGKMRNGSNYTTSSFATNFVYGRKTYIGNIGSNGMYQTLNIPTREGYAFTGWSFSNGTGGQNTSGEKFYFSDTSTHASTANTYIFNGDYKGNITATAQWKDNTPPEWITKDTSGKKVSGGLYINPSSWTNGDAVIKAEATDTGSGMSSVKIYGSNKELATGVSSASYTQSTEGIIYYYVVATDKAGNKATTSTKAAYVDKTPPLITAGVSSAGWTNKDIRLTATATDALSGVQKVEIFTASGKSVASGKTGAAYTITEPTNEEYIIRATDAAGNTAEKKQSIQLDKENSDVVIDDGTGTPIEFKPGAATESHVIGWVNNDVPIKITAADSLSGIKTIELKDHYGNVIKSDSKELQYTFTNEGISHYTIIVTDNAENTKTINLTVKIDKTPPVIIGDEEVKDPTYGLIEHQAVDSISGIKSFRLYYYDTMEEVTEDDGLEYKDNNIISFKSMNTFNLYWKLIAEDNAGNITEMTVHTPFNFKIKVEADNLRTETENFLIGADAQLKITLWGYVDTVEVKFERTLEDAAEKEEYTLDRLIESGDAFIRVPEKNDYVEYTFKLPEGVDPREYRIWVYGYRDGWKRTEYTDINLITYEQLCKEQVHKFKRVIKSSTWHRVEDRE